MHGLNVQRGFTLVELSIVLMIVGLLLAGSLAMIKPYVDSARYNATKEKEEKIASALALFVQNYGRLPCPADPSVTDMTIWGSVNNANVVAGDTIGVQSACKIGGMPTTTAYVGIIPFRALGLSEDNVRDGYGNLMTYAVSSVLTGPPGTSQVHAQCRTTQWFDPMSGAPLNPNKARFCCPNYVAGSDIVVLDKKATGNSVYSGVHSALPGDYADPSSGPTTPANNNSRLIAFVLVSYGVDGDGAFIAHTVKTTPVTVTATAQESENRNSDLTFVWTPTSRKNDNNYFDDIILWKTNDQVISAFGNNGCARP